MRFAISDFHLLPNECGHCIKWNQGHPAKAVEAMLVSHARTAGDRAPLYEAYCSSGDFSALLPVPQKPIQLRDWEEQVPRRSVWPQQAPLNQPMQSWDGNAAEIGARLRLFERARRDGFRVCQSIFLHG